MIDDIIKQIISTKPAKFCDGCLIDARHYFCKDNAWISSFVFERSDPECVMELKSTLSPGVSSLRELKSIQQRIWQELSYSYFEASSIVFYKQASVLTFVTLANKTSSSCMAGRMVVGGAHYHELARRSIEKSGSEKGFPDAPFEISFDDIERSIQSFEKAQEDGRAKNAILRQNELRQAGAVLRQLKEYTDHQKDEYLRSDTLKDAIRWKLQELMRLTHRAEETREWRVQLLPALRTDQVPLSVTQADTLWTAATEHVSKLVELITIPDE